MERGEGPRTSHIRGSFTSCQRHSVDLSGLRPPRGFRPLRFRATRRYGTPPAPRSAGIGAQGRAVPGSVFAVPGSAGRRPISRARSGRPGDMGRHWLRLAPCGAANVPYPPVVLGEGALWDEAWHCRRVRVPYLPVVQGERGLWDNPEACAARARRLRR
jgi:hypothetical protein